MKLTKDYIRALIREERDNLTEVEKGQAPTKAKDALGYLDRVQDSANFVAFWAAALPRLLQPPPGVSKAVVHRIMAQSWPEGGKAAFTAIASGVSQEPAVKATTTDTADKDAAPSSTYNID